MFDANRHDPARHSDSAGLSSGLIGSSPKFIAVFEEARAVAPVDCSVLIRGETGTGKEPVARDSHAKRTASCPFVKLNCAAIPAELCLGFDREQDLNHCEDRIQSDRRGT